MMIVRAGLKINPKNPSKMRPWWIIPVGNGNHMVNEAVNGWEQHLNPTVLSCSACHKMSMVHVSRGLYMTATAVYLSSLGFLLQLFEWLPENALDGRVFGVSKKGLDRHSNSVKIGNYAFLSQNSDLRPWQVITWNSNRGERKMLWISLLESSSLNTSSHRQNRVVVPEVVFVWTWCFSHSCSGISRQSCVSSQSGNPTNNLRIVIVCKWLAMFVKTIRQPQAQQKNDLVS